MNKKIREKIQKVQSFHRVAVTAARERRRHLEDLHRTMLRSSPGDGAELSHILAALAQRINYDTLEPGYLDLDHPLAAPYPDQWTPEETQWMEKQKAPPYEINKIPPMDAGLRDTDSSFLSDEESEPLPEDDDDVGSELQHQWEVEERAQERLEEEARGERTPSFTRRRRAAPEPLGEGAPSNLEPEYLNDEEGRN